MQFGVCLKCCFTAVKSWQDCNSLTFPFLADAKLNWNSVNNVQEGRFEPTISKSRRYRHLVDAYRHWPNDRSGFWNGHFWWMDLQYPSVAFHYLCRRQRRRRHWLAQIRLVVYHYTHLSMGLNAGSENTHHRVSRADLLFDWFGFDQTSKASCCYFNVRKAAESKQNKQEASCTVILTLWWVFSDQAGQRILLTYSGIKPALHKALWFVIIVMGLGTAIRVRYCYAKIGSCPVKRCRSGKSLGSKM